jgi:hypothetical protein
MTEDEPNISSDRGDEYCFVEKASSKDAKWKVEKMR